MKIALFMTTILEQGGGLEKYLIEIANGLSKIGNNDLTIITMDKSYTLKLNSLLRFYYLRKVGPKDIYREKTADVIKKIGNAKYINVNNYKELKNQFKQNDIIYSKNEFIEAGILKFIIGYKNIPPVIFGIHTPHIYPVTATIQAKLHNILYGSWLYNFFTSGAYGFHVSNQFSEVIFRKQFPSKKVFLIYYPFDSKKFQSQKLINKYDLQVLPEVINILWLARISEQKGIDDLYIIINRINSQLADINKVQWNIAGSGELKYMKLISELVTKYPNLKYLGHVENKFVPSILDKTDLFISTSKWEVSPFNILEAQSMDVPVIAYRIPGPEDIINESTGKLVNNREEYIDFLLNFIENKPQYMNISRRIENKFNPDKIFAELNEMFKNAIEKSTNTSEWYDTNYYNHKQEEPEIWYKTAIELLKENPIKSRQLLEIGCGTGVGLKALIDSGELLARSIMGIDLSSNAINQARKNIPNGNFQLAKTQGLKFEDNSCDTILMMEVFEHFENPDIYIREIKRVLRNGGHLLMSFPNYLNFPWYLLRIVSERLNRPSWIMLQPTDNIYNFQSVKNRFERKGFKLIAQKGCVFFPPILYKYEPKGLTIFLNKVGLSFLAFHPVMIFQNNSES